MVVVHTTCSLLSYAAFLLAFVSGILFLIQERQLKRKTLGLLFHRLPPLEALDRINFMAIGVGFALLSIGAASGFLEAGMLLGRWWNGDPKEVLTVALWASYLLLWLMRLRATLRGRRVALLSILGFSLALFTFLGASWIVPSWHPYIRLSIEPVRPIEPVYASPTRVTYDSGCRMTGTLGNGPTGERAA